MAVLLAEFRARVFAAPLLRDEGRGFSLARPCITRWPETQWSGRERECDCAKPHRSSPRGSFIKCPDPSSADGAQEAGTQPPHTLKPHPSAGLET